MVVCALIAAPLVLVGPALLPSRVLLPADLLVHFEPWRSVVSAPPEAYWDPLVWDGVAQFYPWRLFAARSLRAGYLPLWNPHQFCGTPFIANGQSAVFYPPNLLFWVMPVGRAFGWSALLHLVLAGWFAYLFLRNARVGRSGAVAGAVVWQTSSSFVAWVHLPTFMSTAIWIPLVLLLVDRALVVGRARYALGAGIALALSYLGGHPQIFMYVALLTGGYLVARGLTRAAGARLAVRIGRLAKTAVISGAAAATLSGGQLLATLGLLQIAHRSTPAGPEGYAAYLSRAMPPPQLGTLLVPHSLGHPALGTYVGPENFAEYWPYVGIVALGLALCGAASARTWHSWFLTAAAAFAGLSALGTAVNWPLYHWVPMMARAGGPVRILVILVFALAMLAGIGADALFRRLATGGTGAAVAPALVLVALGAGAWAWGSYASSALGRIQPGLRPLARAEMLRAVVLVAAAIGAMALARHRSLHGLAQAVIVVVLAADLLLAAQHHIHVAPQASVYPESADPGPVAGRILGNAADWPINRFPRAVLPPNSATVYGLRDAFGYDSLYLARYRDFAEMVQHGDPSPPLNGNLLLARLGPLYGLDMMSLAGVTTVLSPTPVPGLRIDRAGRYDTYQNPYAYPRAWVAASAAFVPTHRDAQLAMLRAGPIPDCVLITGPDEPAEELTNEARPAVEVRDISPNAVEAVMSGNRGGYLFLADTYAPGWHAYAQGKELRVRAAYLTFRAVALPAGARSVVFRYEPEDFRVGLFASLLALACISGAGGWMALGRRQRR